MFGKRSAHKKKNTGESAIDILLINSVIPVIFSYGRIHDNRILMERSLSFLEDIAPENNSIISDWHTAGFEASSAFESQALLQLRNEYCRKRRCLDCRIGTKLISGGFALRNEQDLVLDSL